MHFACFLAWYTVYSTVRLLPGQRREGRRERKKEGNSIYIRNYVYRSIGVIHLICIRQCGSSESGSRWEGDTVLYHTYLELEFNCSSSSDPYSALDS